MKRTFKPVKKLNKKKAGKITHARQRISSREDLETLKQANRQYRKVG